MWLGRLGTAMRNARRYSDYIQQQGTPSRLRTVLRNATVATLSTRERIGRTSGWIRFPFYHHVFDDEVAGFQRQLRYMRRFGEFLRLDDAIALITGEAFFDDRYFCLTFDDGYRNCFQNALPVLDRLGVPATFFVATDLIGTSVETDRALLGRHFGGSVQVEFMNWEECRVMAGAGMGIGSHTVSHADLLRLDERGVRHELSASKATIEAQLSARCDHFACPFGIPGANFSPSREPVIAADLGYHSFCTGRRGATRPGDSPFFVRRDQLLANWSLAQVRYFLRG